MQDILNRLGLSDTNPGTWLGPDSLEDGSAALIESVNPSTGEVIAKVRSTTPAEYERLVKMKKSTAQEYLNQAAAQELVAQPVHGEFAQPRLSEAFHQLPISALCCLEPSTLDV